MLCVGEAGPSDPAATTSKSLPSSSPPHREDPELDMDALRFMPHNYLEQFVDLLGLQTTTEPAALRIGKITLLLIERQPSLAPVLIKAMRRCLDR